MANATGNKDLTIILPTTGPTYAKTQPFQPTEYQKSLAGKSIAELTRTLGGGSYGRGTPASALQIAPVTAQQIYETAKAKELAELKKNLDVREATLGQQEQKIENRTESIESLEAKIREVEKNPFAKTLPYYQGLINDYNNKISDIQKEVSLYNKLASDYNAWAKGYSDQLAIKEITSMKEYAPETKYIRAESGEIRRVGGPLASDIVYTRPKEGIVSSPTTGAYPPETTLYPTTNLFLGGQGPGQRVGLTWLFEETMGIRTGLGGENKSVYQWEQEKRIGQGLPPLQKKEIASYFVPKTDLEKMLEKRKELPAVKYLNQLWDTTKPQREFVLETVGGAGETGGREFYKGLITISNVNPYKLVSVYKDKAGNITNVKYGFTVGQGGIPYSEQGELWFGAGGRTMAQVAPLFIPGVGGTVYMGLAALASPTPEEFAISFGTGALIGGIHSGAGILNRYGTTLLPSAAQPVWSAGTKMVSNYLVPGYYSAQAGLGLLSTFEPLRYGDFKAQREQSKRFVSGFGASMLGVKAGGFFTTRAFAEVQKHAIKREGLHQFDIAVKGTGKKTVSYTEGEKTIRLTRKQVENIYNRVLWETKGKSLGELSGVSLKNVEALKGDKQGQLFTEEVLRRLSKEGFYQAGSPTAYLGLKGTKPSLPFHDIDVLGTSVFSTPKRGTQIVKQTAKEFGLEKRVVISGSETAYITKTGKQVHFLSFHTPEMHAANIAEYGDVFEAYPFVFTTTKAGYKVMQPRVEWQMKLRGGLAIGSHRAKDVFSLADIQKGTEYLVTQPTGTQSFLKDTGGTLKGIQFKSFLGEAKTVSGQIAAQAVYGYGAKQTLLVPSTISTKKYEAPKQEYKSSYLLPKEITAYYKKESKYLTPYKYETPYKQTYAKYETYTPAYKYETPYEKLYKYEKKYEPLYTPYQAPYKYEKYDVYTPYQAPYKAPYKTPYKYTPYVAYSPYKTPYKYEKYAPYTPYSPYYKKPPPPIIKDLLRGKPETIGFGYQVLVREKGKKTTKGFKSGEFTPITKGVLSKEQALALGQAITAGTAKRSFKLAPALGEPASVGKLPAFRPEMFYKKGRTFIEKTKYAIDMPGEFKEITQKGRATKRKTKRLSGFRPFKIFSKKLLGGA